MNVLDRLPFARIIFADSEYFARPGERVLPICFVAMEYRTGCIWRVGMGEFGARAPFPVDKQTVLISYSIPAEMSVFEACRWPRPSRAIDLFAEHRVNINGLSCKDLSFPLGEKSESLWSARGAMICHGLDPTSAALKEDLYALTVDRGPPYSRAELMRIMAACEQDVADLIKLAERMFPRILERKHGLVHALNRGASGIGMAAAEATGIPIDTELLGRLRGSWEHIKGQLASDADREYGIFDGNEISQKKFAAFMAKHKIAWPRTPKPGELCTDKDTFKDMARGQAPQAPEPAARNAVHLRADAPERPPGRRRRPQQGAFKPFWAKTGRCQPSSSQYIFGNATWYRGLIKPGPGGRSCMRTGGARRSGSRLS